MTTLPTCLNDFVDSTQYKEIAQEILAMAKQKGAMQAEVGLQHSIGLNVSVRMQEVDTLEFNRDKSLAITVYINQRKGSASTNDFQKESLCATVDAAIHLAQLTEPDAYAGLAEASEMATACPDLQLYHPWTLSVEEAIAMAKSCEQSAFSSDARIINSDGSTFNSSQTFRVYANSHGFMGAYPSSRHSLSCTVIARENETGMERDYDYTVARRAGDLEKAEIIGRHAAQNAVKRLHAQKIATQKVPVLFHAKVASGLIGHCLAGLSGARLFRNTSFLQDSLGQSLFPSFVTFSERPHQLYGLASATFDSDGVATTEKNIVQEGIVQHYILSAYSARKLKMKSTGNAGGVHNLLVSHGQDDFDAMVRKMHKGIIVTELMGQGINLVTGDYSRGAIGFWVENGKIQYPIHEMTIAGHLKEMFSNIVAIGADVDKRNVVQTGSILVEEMMVAGV